MKWLLLPALLLVLSAVTAAAQSLVLRSGEHDGFTRLVMNLPEDAQWQITSEAKVLQLTFNTVFSDIDLSNAFTRISRERVYDIKVRLNNQGLDILLNCECGFRAAIEQSSLFIIDIGESLPKTTGDQRKSIEEDIAISESTTDNFVKLPIAIKDHSSILSPQSLIPEIKLRNEDDPSEVKAASQDIGEETNINLETLNAQISNATIQGLLKLNDQSQVTPLQSYRDPLSIQRPPNMRTLFATEIDVSAQTLETQYDDTCPPEVDFNIGNWGNEAGFAAGLIGWRQSIMKEFDEVNVEAVLGLARHYLHYGFGQEAQAALDLLPSSIPQVEHLRIMARIVDFGYDPLGVVTFSNMACGGEGALWSALAVQNFSAPVDLDISALRLAFEGLPQNLKQYLGPRLAEKFAELGDNSTAESILASISQRQNDRNPALEFSQAIKVLNGNDAAAAAAPLQNVLESNSQFSPLALVGLVDAAVAANQTIDDRLVDLVAAYQFEHRQTELSPELARAQVLSLAFSGQFDEAFERLEEFKDESSSLIYSETRSRVMIRLLEGADDIEFLKAALREPILGLTAPFENRFAGRLLDLGFAENALEILSETADGQDGQARRLLRAKAALLLNEPIVAEAELMGISDDAAISLRQEARRRQGDYSEALLKNFDDDAEQNIQDLARLTGARPLIDTLDGGQNDQGTNDPSRRPATDELIMGEAAPNGMLNKAKSLIEDSSTTRTTLQDLLSRFQVDAEAVR